MAAIFTPGLKVREHTVVLKDRRLPMEGEVLVSTGDVVSADQVVARTSLPGKVYPVNVANQLGVDPGRLRTFMKKSEGDPVSIDEVVAETPGLWGLFKSESRSIVTGTLESISTVTGQVIFQANPIPVEIDAYIEGRVVEVVEGEGCLVQSKACLIQGIFGLGGEVKAPLVMAVEDPTEVLDSGNLREDMAGQVIVGGSYITLGGLKRAAEIGVAGVVVGGFDYDDIKALLGYEVGVAITGGEKLGLTLVVTEGFGRIQMAPATFALLRSMTGKRASINGATQIRAGVIRPEVVVTYSADETPASRVEAEEPKGIALGDQVRGIRTPHFGRIGTVVGLPVSPTVLDTESRARVMEVEFETGETSIVPRANVEVIES